MAVQFHMMERKYLVLGVLGVVGAFIVGILIGVFSSGSGAGQLVDKFENKEFVSSVIDKVSTDNLRDFLKLLSDKPHIAAGTRDKFLTNWIMNKWEEFGLEDVSLSAYNILLSYPNSDKPNKIYLYDQNNQQKFVSRHEEEVLREEDADPNFIHAFNAYTPPGDVSGELVYVNYARVEDLQELEKLGVDLRGKIAIARYGKIFRGNKLRNCENKGAIGVIFFSDPLHVTNNNTDPSAVYPNTQFLPESGIQRGSTFIGDGDPLSPGYTSIPGAYRRDKDHEFNDKPKIPCQPIGYGDAKRLLEVMGGDVAPEAWRGSVPGVEYKLGPGFDQQHQGWRVRLVVNNYLEDKEDNNIVGIIRGEVEPDRYVIISNHRDAWGYGSIDPSGGTATLMEAARLFGSLLKAGWRPRRTLVFASWAAEEYGLMGSNEWVHDKIHKLKSRAVSMINVDICNRGDVLEPFASPSLKTAFVDALRLVPDFKDGSRKYYDVFNDYIKAGNPADEVEDKIRTLGSGSDHAAFAFVAGVPAFYFRIAMDKRVYKNAGAYPTYHTGFETFYLVDKILDPGFKRHRTCTQIATHMLMQFSESLLLPYDLDDVLIEIRKGLKKLVDNKLVDKLNELGLQKEFNLMQEKIGQFNKTAKIWKKSLIDKKEEIIENELKLRIINDQIMNLERVFLLSDGLPGRPDIKHSLFSPAKFNSYGSAAFPGIGDLLHEFDKLTDKEKEERTEELKRHLSDLMIVFHQAQQWLADVHLV